MTTTPVLPAADIKVKWGQRVGCDLPTPAAFGPVAHSQGEQPFFSAEQMRDYALAAIAAAQAAKIVQPLSDERITEIQNQTIRNWQSSDKCIDGWKMLARAIEAAHGITASKGAA